MESDKEYVCCKLMKVIRSPLSFVNLDDMVYSCVKAIALYKARHDIWSNLSSQRNMLLFSVFVPVTHYVLRAFHSSVKPLISRTPSYKSYVKLEVITAVYFIDILNYFQRHRTFILSSFMHGVWVIQWNYANVLPIWRPTHCLLC